VGKILVKLKKIYFEVSHNVLVPIMNEKKVVRTQFEKRVKIAIAQEIVVVLDGRDYVRLYENVWFVTAVTFVLFEIKQG